MYVQLTMAERLKDLRVIDKKLTLEQLAEQTGLSKSALGKYENEDCGDINHYAIQKLAKFYGVSTDYLLGLTEQKNHSDVDVASLHLSDEVLELLRSGKINNRLLCEMMTHPQIPPADDRHGDRRRSHRGYANSGYEHGTGSGAPEGHEGICA